MSLIRDDAQITSLISFFLKFSVLSRHILIKFEVDLLSNKFLTAFGSEEVWGSLLQSVTNHLSKIIKVLISMITLLVCFDRKSYYICLIEFSKKFYIDHKRCCNCFIAAYLLEDFSSIIYFHLAQNFLRDRIAVDLRE